MFAISRLPRHAPDMHQKHSITSCSDLRRVRVVMAPMCASKGFGTSSKSAPTPSKPKLHEVVDRSVAPKKFASVPQPAKVVDDEPGACPCCSGTPYKSCCGRYHAPGAVPAPTKETTLRARFSACVKNLPGYLAATTHDDYLAFHFGPDVPIEEARRKHEAETSAACTDFAYKGLKIAPGETPVVMRSASPRGGKNRGQDEADASVKCQYLFAPRAGVPAESAASANDGSSSSSELEWTRMVQDICFRRGKGGMWQMTGYKQILELDETDISKLVTVRQEEASSEAEASGPDAARRRDWRLDPASRSAQRKVAPGLHHQSHRAS